MSGRFSKKAIIFLLIFLGTLAFIAISAYALSQHTYYGYAYEDEDFSKKVEDGTVITACVRDHQNDLWYNQTTTVNNSLSNKNYLIIIQPSADMYQDDPIYWYIGTENTTNDSLFRNINTNYPNNQPFFNLTINDIPQITDNTDRNGTTGDSFDFNVTVIDYIDTGAQLTVNASWSHNGSSGNETLTNSAGNYFTGSIALGHNLSDMTYRIWYNDTSNNYNNTILYSVNVTDNDPPTSQVNSISGFWKNSTNNPLTINATANDNIGLKNISLYYNYSSDNTSYNGWTLFDTDEDPWAGISYSFTFPEGSGYYLFYTIARDNQSQNESAPGSYDEFCGYDNINPITQLYSLSPYWAVSDTVVLNTTTASDSLSGIAVVNFYYYNSTDNQTFSGPYLAFSDSSSPYSYSFNFTNFNGSGYYRFYSIGIDIVSNIESAPVTNDTRSAYGIVTTEVNTISPYWYNSTPITITAAATDLASSIKNVSLYYYHSTDNQTYNGPYYYSVNSTPWTDLSSVSFSFNFSNNTGYYRFYTRGSDNFSNYEPAPTSPNYDEDCAYDNTSPIVLISIPQNNEYYNSLNTISGTCSDTNSGVNIVNITIYNMSGSTYWNGSGWNSSITWFSSIMGGSYTTWSYDSSNAIWNNGSLYRVSAVAIDNQSRSSTTDTNQFYYDAEKPSSNVTTITPYWLTTSPLWINASASDIYTTVSNVTLYWYFSSDNLTFNGPYSNGTDTLTPFSWNFSFSNGSGFYRFYSIAMDPAGNTEQAPTTNDTICGYDNVAPTCTIEFSNPRTYYKDADTITIYANFTEITSGIDPSSVQISINYTGGTDLSATAMTQTNNTLWTYSLNIPAGSTYNGQFRINITATDNASNSINPDPTYNDSKYIDNTIPSSQVTAISPFNQTSSDNLTIIANISDSYGGVKNISLYYYNSTNNFTFNGPYLVSTNSTPWLNSSNIIWYFNFTNQNGTGYYRFYSLATDNATNSESAPTDNDTYCYYGMLNRAPYAASLVSPADGSSSTSSSRTLDWAYVGDPDGDDEANATYAILYEIGDSTPDVIVNASTNLSSYSATCSTTGTYYWRIITYDNNSIGTLGPVWSFSKTSPGGGGGTGGGTGGSDQTNPTAPTNVTCTSGSTDTTPTFTWDAATDNVEVEGYYVKIDNGEEIEIGDVLTYEWQTELADGTYTFYVRAKDTSDNYGNNGSCEFTIDTSGGGPTNQEPVADAGGPYSGLTFENITFDGSDSTDLDGNIVNYTWNFGDGTNGYGLLPVHSYDTAGLFDLTLTVTDDGGATDINTTIVNITLDSDGDSWSDDVEDAYETDKNDPDSGPTDTDGDGIPDDPAGEYEGDPDDDNDGIEDSEDDYPKDHDNDGIDDKDDNDKDNDGIDDSEDDYPYDYDNDGIDDVDDTDDDNDGISDEKEEEFGTDPKNSSGVKKLPGVEGQEGKSYFLLDIDEDGIYDIIYSPDNEKVKFEKVEGTNTYNIDFDGDKNWDYTYDSIEGSIKIYEKEKPVGGIPTWLIAVLLVVIIIILIIIAMFKTGYLYIEDEEENYKSKQVPPVKKTTPSSKKESPKKQEKKDTTKKTDTKKSTTTKKKK